METLKSILYFIVFPGFLFTAIAGILVSWIDRKVTALVQWRVGPPFMQPLYDFVKLLGKETIIPRGSSKFTFLLSPVLSLTSITIVSTMLWHTFIMPSKGFVGDLIVIVYLLVMPSIAIILAGFSSANPLSSIGASREMKLLLSYELPFIISVLVAVINSGNEILMGNILMFQNNNGAIAGSLSGILAFVVAILCMQAKLALVPFDAPEAETEITGGPFIEYSGTPLAIFKLSRWMLLFVLPLFLVGVFWGGFRIEGIDLLWSVLKYVALLVVIILIKNTAPRFRIDQVLKLFWGPITFLAILAVILAYLGV
ncbi:MAG: NADH-quinone oxidoreductase subunit H [Candidatus Mcinerneyibacterium aminivorans]|uniref:NADH-quinone oxidoreductase subunit H n=1 Tax=Candidatus Mcinerneyibacterium aminivorans TaxID=2703815 RepID=A0A5D0MFC4_9BACT|nr:MAG: NADH-quinone oxidoreductase subunit H [Candidatus Mcinerneyibacterium aminivorans]